MKLKLKEPWCLRGYRGDLFVLEKSGSIEIPYRLKYPLYELLSKCDGVTEMPLIRSYQLPLNSLFPFF